MSGLTSRNSYYSLLRPFKCLKIQNMVNLKHILFFNQISIADIAEVGGKNASLGEMYCQLNPIGIKIPNGFSRLFSLRNSLYPSAVSENPLGILMPIGFNWQYISPSEAFLPPTFPMSEIPI